jgi:hypothetical protein
VDASDITAGNQLRQVVEKSAHRVEPHTQLLEGDDG